MILLSFHAPQYSIDLPSALFPHCHFVTVVQLAVFFIAYYALVLVFAGILVAMESRTGGRCGFDGYKTWSKSCSYYELAFELSWTTVSFQLLLLFCLIFVVTVALVT